MTRSRLKVILINGINLISHQLLQEQIATLPINSSNHFLHSQGNSLLKHPLRFDLALEGNQLTLFLTR